jgi:hypothetical protein
MAKNRVKRHQEDCECVVCDSGLPPKEALAAMQLWQAEMMEKHGWYCHMVGEDTDSPTGFNAHTHGMDLVGKQDFQIVCPMPGDVANHVLANLVERSKNEELAAGMELDKIIGGYKVRLVLAKEGDRQVLRAIMPDKAGRLGADAAPPFNTQAEGCLAVG